MAMPCLMGVSRASERRAETMVTPALGPSLGVAPSGTCKWMDSDDNTVQFGALDHRKP